MKQKLIILIVLIVIIAGIAVLMFKRNHGNSRNGSGVGEDIIYSEIPVISTKTIKEEKDNIYIDMEIPQISNINASYCDYINQKIQKDLEYETIYNNDSITDDVKQKFNYETRYECYKDGDFLSLVVTQKSTYGTNREKQEKKCYVIDAKNTKTAYLEDVASEPYNYKYYIVSRINDIAFSKRIELIGGNSLTTINDSQSFYIKDGKMHIYFTSGQISPVSYGELDLEMPFKFENGRFILE